jgi:hypothetical protein
MKTKQDIQTQMFNEGLVLSLTQLNYNMAFLILGLKF